MTSPIIKRWENSDYTKTSTYFCTSTTIVGGGGGGDGGYSPTSREKIKHTWSSKDCGIIREVL